jgi:hypothetical protein
MTSKEKDIKIERVPLPEVRVKEMLNPNVLEAIMSLAPEESFFIATDDEDHTQRKVSALRQRVHRIQIAAPDKQFTVRKRHENNQMGVRVFRLPNENN